jgi:hypothetical protein
MERQELCTTHLKISLILREPKATPFGLVVVYLLVIRKLWWYEKNGIRFSPFFAGWVYPS